MTIEEIALKLAELEQRSFSNIRRIEKLEVQTEAIQDIATSIKLIVREQGFQTEAIGRIEKNMEKLDGKVEVLEKKPAKRWDGVVDKIVMTLIGGVVLYILVKLGLG